MAQKTVNIALIGQGFMGRSHSNAWTQVARFFNPNPRPVMHTSFGQPEENPPVFAEKWGWQNVSTNWKKTMHDPAIQIVDIVTPNYMHATMAKEAVKAGKIVCCEKPIAGTLKEAREMAAAAKKLS